jgi:hypothetical protein
MSVCGAIRGGNVSVSIPPNHKLIDSDGKKLLHNYLERYFGLTCGEMQVDCISMVDILSAINIHENNQLSLIL